MGCLSAIEKILMFSTCTAMLYCLQFCLIIEVSSISEVPSYLTLYAEKMFYRIRMIKATMKILTR